MDTIEITKYAKRFASILGPGLEQVMTLVVLVEKDRVPFWAWPILGAAVAYFLNPFDALPDPIFLDDIGVLVGAIASLECLITDDIRAEARLRVNSILK